MNQYLDQITGRHMDAVHRQTTDVAALAASGCTADTLSLAISELRERVTALAAAAREQRKEEANNR